MDAKLIKAVKNQLGDNSYLEDVANHGADAGFPGFTYYSDTLEFYKKNRTEIVQLTKDMAAEFGETPINMILNFNCLKNMTTEEDVALALYGNLASVGKNDNLVPNALAWFALEEVARFETDK